MTLLYHYVFIGVPLSSNLFLRYTLTMARNVTVVDWASVALPRRRRRSPYRDSPEWKDAIRLMHKLPRGNALRIELSVNTSKLGKVPWQAFSKLLKRYLRDEHLEDEYTVRYRGKDARKNRIIIWFVSVTIRVLQTYSIREAVHSSWRKS